MNKLTLLTFSSLIAIGLSAPATVNAETHRQQANWINQFKWQEYMAYEQREPCQNYQIATFKSSRCWGKSMAEADKYRLRPVIMEYTVFFDFDDANIRSSENAIIARVSHDILTYQPYEVTIVGHTDTSGSDKYNLALSQKRATSVSTTLNGIGIPNRILEEGAVGESDLAVPTADGVRLRENRRVVIQFRK